MIFEVIPSILLIFNFFRKFRKVLLENANPVPFIFITDYDRGISALKHIEK